MSSLRWLGLLGWAAIAFGCARSQVSLGALDDRGSTATHPSGNAAAANSAQAGSGSKAPGSTGLESAGDRGSGRWLEGDSDVWIGELRTYRPKLCGLDGSPNIGGTGDGWYVRPEGYLERVVMILEPRASSVPTGQIAFGEGPRAETPSDLEALPEEDPYWGCSKLLPTRGFEYSLMNLELTGNTLIAEIAPNEIWAGWCPTQTRACGHELCEACECDPRINYCWGPRLCEWYEPCQCQAGKCSSQLWYRLSVDLVVTTDTMEGAIEGLGDVRLHRAQ